MTQSNILFIGLNVHKESVSGAYMADDRRAEVSYYGAIGTRQYDIDKLTPPARSHHPGRQQQSLPL